MRDYRAEILENLDEIEKKYDVKILHAVESGSRAWGFSSPDSDYDVRFVYMQRPEEYLRVDPVKDVIEWQAVRACTAAAEEEERARSSRTGCGTAPEIDDILDINGWDVKKALLAFAKGNPNIMEWAGSPVVYRSTEEWNALKDTAMRYFSEKSALCHYYGTANSTYKGFLTGDLIKYKKYFYALRPLLCCHWIERYHEAPPVAFEKLLGLFEEPDDVLTPELYAAVRELLVRKAETVEKKLNPQMPVIIDFIRNECERQKRISDAAPDDRRHDFREINEAFRKLLSKAVGCDMTDNKR